jgi:hypothetical protein
MEQLGQVELLVPALENLNEDGAQQRLWDLARLYLDTLQEKLGDQVRLISPYMCDKNLRKCLFQQVMTSASTKAI